MWKRWRQAGYDFNVVLDDKFYTQKEDKSDSQIQQEMLELQKMLKEGKL